MHHVVILCSPLFRDQDQCSKGFAGQCCCFRSRTHSICLSNGSLFKVCRLVTLSEANNSGDNTCFGALIALALLFCRDRQMKAMIFHWLLLEHGHYTSENRDEPMEQVTQAEKRIQLCHVCRCCSLRVCIRFFVRNCEFSWLYDVVEEVGFIVEKESFLQPQRHAGIGR